MTALKNGVVDARAEQPVEQNNAAVSTSHWHVNDKKQRKHRTNRSKYLRVTDAQSKPT